jgi:hypothetical protein
VSGRSRAESQVGVRLMGVWRVSYSNIQDFFFFTFRGGWAGGRSTWRGGRRTERAEPDGRGARKALVLMHRGIVGGLGARLATTPPPPSTSPRRRKYMCLPT